MKLRRRRRELDASDRQRVLEICPSCGHVSPPLQGRIFDPVGLRSICVRCGHEFEGPK